LLSNFALSLNTRFPNFGGDGDLEESVTTYRRAIVLTPEGHNELPNRINNLASSLESHFSRFGDDAALEEAIVNYRRASTLTAEAHRDLPTFFNNLSLSLHTRFVRFGEDEDLEEASLHSRRTITLTPDGHNDVPTWLNSLALLLESRFTRFGEDGDLEEAVNSYQRAIMLTPEGHIDLPIRLNNLANSLKVCFSRFGEDIDIEEAIINWRRAITLTPEGHSDLPIWLSDLAASLESCFSRFGEDAVLEEAVVNYRRAITLIPEGHNQLPGRLSNLAGALIKRLSRFEEDVDLEEAIVNYRRAIALTPADHSDLSLWLNNFGLSLKIRFSRFGEGGDLEEAITTCRRAITLTPEGHNELPNRLNSLANLLKSRFSRSAENANLEEAFALYHRGSTMRGGSTRDKYDSATGLATLAHTNNRMSVALAGYTAAIALMSQVAWFGQSAASRQRALALQPANFASNAAACAIHLGLLETAVELLDHGRSVFWSQATDSEIDMRELTELDPDLAAQFQELARALDASTFQDSVIGSEKLRAGNQIEQRRLLTKGMESLLERVRKLSNFHNFMKPPPFSELRISAASGPVILLNASSYRCDALIVTADSPPRLVPLPDMSLDDASRVAKDFHGDQGSRDFRSRLEQHLPFVWRTVVQPVLLALGYMERPASTACKPRVWWCPTGPFSFIPIHAAGPYTRSGGPDLTKRVLSSYIPTLRALLRARSKHLASGCRVLLVAQSETPDQPPLPRESEEVKLIYKAVCSKYGASEVLMLEGPDALKDVVVAKLKDMTCAHFACHGGQGQTEGALQSALFVHDGPLLLSTIASNRLPKAEFAFLSACSTASGSDRLPDEAMHIAAGMLIAGFRSVIATMWTIGDGAGPRVAEKVYDDLLRNAPDKFDSKEAALALNEGVQSLRKAKYPTSDWVPFIHIGI
jgi:tetratricopeptide (TPR) repeat protein